MAAVFSWRCPTYGCRGLIIRKGEPVHDSVAVCERPAEGAFCGREMRWDGYSGAWPPITPFQGFQ